MFYLVYVNDTKQQYELKDKKIRLKQIKTHANLHL